MDEDLRFEPGDIVICPWRPKNDIDYTVFEKKGQLWCRANPHDDHPWIKLARDNGDYQNYCYPMNGAMRHKNPFSARARRAIAQGEKMIAESGKAE